MVAFLKQEKKEGRGEGRRDFTQKEEKEMKKNEIGKRNGPPDFFITIRK